jgi:hypothetical protein
MGKYIINESDGGKRTTALTFGDRGKQLTQENEIASTGSTIKQAVSFTEWDEFGHPIKGEQTEGLADGESMTFDVEASDLKVNEDGSTASVTQVYTNKNESIGEGEVASVKRTLTVEYGNDMQVIQKFTSEVEYLDKSGALLKEAAETKQFDENGLQTSYTYKSKDSGGVYDMTCDITWTKDASGKPVSYEFALTENGGDPIKSSGDVTLDESGMISKISNVKVNGQERSTTVEVSYEKIDDPLPGALEGWKSLPLTDMLFTIE